MCAFLRPGAKQRNAFGISFDADREANAAPPVLPVNLASDLGLHEQRKRLPIAKCRKEILYLVENHATTVIVGETGSGKTTQIPQFLHEAGWTTGGRKVVCTQPRRVAAMTVASRVAEEMGCSVGQTVGYSIRFEDLSTPGITSIKFCTDGVLLREMMQDPLLSIYSVIMLDEAHERSLATDLLLGLLKKVQQRRPDLRIIVASATLQARKVADFFTTATTRSDTYRRPALLSVEGRGHDVQVYYLQQPAPDYVKMAVHAATELHRQNLPGDVLIFLTGQEECELAVSLLEEEARKLRRHRSGLKLFPVSLYAGLPAASQLQAFEVAPRGYRKVVVATNIAETSLTIPGVVFVIDSCFSKQALYNPLTGLQSLMVGPISKASAAQRAGRAGRLSPGHCLRLCTEEAFAKLSDEAVPEMQRSDLASAVMQLKALGVDNIMKFDFLSAPPSEAMVRALELLFALGALTKDARLSAPLGQQMAELPLDSRLGRALLAAAQTGCSEEVATVVAMLSVQSVWFAGQGQAALAAAKAKFAVGEGDLIAYLNVWEAWVGAGVRRPSWAHRHCLNHRTLLRAADIRSQLCSHLRRLGLSVESAEGDVDKVQRALAHGLFAAAARFDKMEVSEKHHMGTNVYRLVHQSGPGKAPRLRIHSGSVLHRTKPPLVLFWQIQQGAHGFYDMQDLLVVEPGWLPEIAPEMYELKGRPKPCPGLA